MNKNISTKGIDGADRTSCDGDDKIEEVKVPFDALAQFYHAINNADIDEMGRNWNQSDNTADAFAKAVEHHEKNLGKVFNIVDNEPVRPNELSKYIAGILGAKKPGTIPVFLAKPTLGSDVVKFLLVSSRAKNGSAKSDLNWNLSYPTYREGYKSVIEAWKQS